MNDWQPIETAPKDGSYYLATDGKERRICGPDDDNPDFIMMLEWLKDTFKPSHWMPLPEPPALLLTEEDEHTHSSGQHWCPECGPL